MKMTPNKKSQSKPTVAGVDITAGYRAVELIKATRCTTTPGVLSDLAVSVASSSLTSAA